MTIYDAVRKQHERITELEKKLLGFMENLNRKQESIMKLEAFKNDTLEEVNSNVDLILKNKEMLLWLGMRVYEFIGAEHFGSYRQFEMKFGGENVVDTGVRDASEKNNGSLSTDSKPPRCKLCIGCGGKFEGGIEAYVCGECADLLLNKNVVIVERKDLERGKLVIESLNSFIDHHTNDFYGDKLYLELIEFFKKYLKK